VDESVALAVTSIHAAVETFIGPDFGASSTAEAPDLWDASLAGLDDAYKAYWLDPAQHYFACHCAQSEYDALIAGLDDNTPAGLFAKAQLQSIAGKGASAWLEILPTARCLMLSNGDFSLAMQRRLGFPNLPRGAPTVTCFCGVPLASTDSEHAHTCSTPNALSVLRHDNILEVVRRALRRRRLLVQGTAARCSSLCCQGLPSGSPTGARISHGPPERATDNSGQTARRSCQAGSTDAGRPGASPAPRRQPGLPPITEDTPARDGECCKELCYNQAG
jgi:hypothetical protein